MSSIAMETISSAPQGVGSESISLRTQKPVDKLTSVCCIGCGIQKLQYSMNSSRRGISNKSQHSFHVSVVAASMAAKEIAANIYLEVVWHFGKYSYLLYWQKLDETIIIIKWYQSAHLSQKVRSLSVFPKMSNNSFQYTHLKGCIGYMQRNMPCEQTADSTQRPELAPSCFYYTLQLFSLDWLIFFTYNSPRTSSSSSACYKGKHTYMSHIFYELFFPNYWDYTN